MRKKLAVGAAMLGGPDILFLDEALNGVDFESAYRIKRVLKRFAAEGGTVILSTHMLESIEKLCGRFWILKDGRLKADLESAELKAPGFRKRHGDLERYVVRLLSRKSPPQDR
jgi:ABC-type multidrug transport system ATPase subunit